MVISTGRLIDRSERNIFSPPSIPPLHDCRQLFDNVDQNPFPDLIDTWLPGGLIGHIQVNDTNRRGPGQGEDRFAAVFAALLRNGYQGTVAVEPFDYHPDGPGAAARAAGYVRGILEVLER